MYESSPLSEPYKTYRYNDILNLNNSDPIYYVYSN